MKNILNTLLYGRGNRLNGLIALAVIMSIALGCNCTKSLDLNNSSGSSTNSSSDNPFGNSSSSSDDTGEMPDDVLLKALVKETTADFAAAVSSGDFTNMYEKASANFQATYTKDQFQSAFKNFVDKKRQVLPILAKAVSSDPDFTSAPRIRTEQGMSILVTEGKYTTKPLPITFNYEYIKRDGRWKLLVFKIFVR